MAVKFSEFTEETVASNITGIVGYVSSSNLNVRIAPADLNTSYDLTATDNATNNVPLVLTGSDGSTDTVNLVGTGTVFLSSTGNVITIEGGVGVSTFTNANGTYVSATTVNTNATGDVTTGVIDLSAVDGTSDSTTRFLSKDNTWDLVDRGVTGSGTANIVPLWTDTTVLGDSVIAQDGTNIGIGTTTPADKLSISSSLNQIGLDSGDIATYGTLDLGMFTNGAFIGTQAGSDTQSDLLRFGTSGTERMRIDSSGNVGFNEIPENSNGTWRNFEVGGVNIVSRFTGNNDGFFGTGYVFKTDNSEVYKNTEAVSRVFFNNNIIEFQQAPSGTAGTAISWDTPLKIDSSGNVGIGTTSPTTPLHIEGSGVGYIQTIKNTTAGGDLLQMLAEDGNPIFEFTSEGTGGEGVFSAYSDNVKNVQISADPSNYTYFNASNVGINVTDPDAQLEIVNSLGGSYRLGYGGTNAYFDAENFYVRSGNGNTNKVIINSSGNVGIGTTTPGADLEIYTSSGGENTLRLNTNFAGGNTVDINPYDTGVSNDGMEIKLNNSQKLVINSTGQVKFNNYTSASAFTGTAVANLAVDSSGNIITDASPVPDNSITSSKVGNEFKTSAAVGSSATENIDWTSAQIFTLTPSQSTTLNVTNPVIGVSKSFVITGSGSSYTITLNVGGAAGTFNLISGEYDDTAGVKNLYSILCVSATEFWYSISQIAT